MSTDVDECGVPFLESSKIQDIAKAGKAERKSWAEVKRQLDMQRIKDMKSTEGIHPLEQFPNEIWVKILETLCPEDLGKVWSVHPHFRELLESNRIRDILLPQILKLSNFRQYIRRKSPHEIKYGVENHFGKDLNRLRSVSRSMRNAVDRWVENSTVASIQGSNGGELLACPILVRHNAVHKTWASFQGPNAAKRFYPRGLLVQVPTWGDHVHGLRNQNHVRIVEKYAQVEHKLTALLEKIGDQIWTFHCMIGAWRQHELGWEREEIILSKVYLSLQRWSLLMPNLKWLALEFVHVPGNKTISLPLSVIEDSPFPRLPSLKKVYVQFGDLLDNGLTTSEAFRIFEAVAGANQHVDMLEFAGSDERKLQVLPTRVIKSLPLTYFAVRIPQPGDITWGDNLSLRFQGVQTLMNCKWNLKAIRLDLYEPSAPLFSVLRYLEQFPALERIGLWFENSVKIGFDGDFSGYLKLPNLKSFFLSLTKPEIDYSGGNISFFFSLQFLLHCKRLTCLYWNMLDFDDDKLRHHLNVDERRDGMIDFMAGMGALYDSIIWDVFPHLNYVSVKNRKLGISTDCTNTYRRSSVRDGMLTNRFLELHSCCRLGGVKDCMILKSCLNNN